MAEVDSTGRRARPWGAALLAAGTLCACGVGGAAAGSAGGGGGGGTAPPVIQSSTIVGVQGRGRNADDVVVGGIVKIEYRLAHLKERLEISPEYFSAGVWQPMTTVPLAGTDPVSSLDPRLHADDDDQAFTIAWNTVADLGVNPGTPSKVRARIRFDPHKDSADVRVTKVFSVDNRLATTVLSRGLNPGPRLVTVATAPCGLRLAPDALYVATSFADIVDRIDPATGAVSRFVGRGEAVDTSPAQIRTPATGDRVATQPRTLLGLALDPAGNVLTTNQYYFQLARTEPRELLTLKCGPGGAGPPEPLACRRPVVQPDGAILYTTACAADGAQFGRVLAFNPGATEAHVGALAVPPGECREVPLPGYLPSRVPPREVALDSRGLLYFEAGDSDPTVTDIHARGQLVYVLNTTGFPVTVGTVDVPPGETRPIAGPYDGRAQIGADDKTFSPPLQTRFPDIHSHLSITISSDDVLFIGAPFKNNERIWACHLGAGDAPRDFAGKKVRPAVAGTMGTLIVAGGPAAGEAPAVTYVLEAVDPFMKDPVSPPINALETDADGNLLFARAGEVLFLSRQPLGGATFSRFGLDMAPATPTRIYDADAHKGLPIAHPRALAARQDTLFFSDDQSIQALNLTDRAEQVCGVTIAPGASGVIGAAEKVRAMAFDGVAGLLVADTESDRIRVLNLGNPGTSGPIIVAGTSIAPGSIGTIVGHPDPGCGPAPLSDAAVGDGGAPEAGSLCRPEGVTVRLADGVIFIADTLHHRIRAVNQSLATIQVGTVAVAPHTIRTVVGNGTDVTDASDAPLVSQPTALAVDGALLYFADAGNPRIRVLNTSGAAVRVAAVDVPAGAVRTLCGTGTRGMSVADAVSALSADISSPQGLFVLRHSAGGGTLYFTDSFTDGSGTRDVLRQVDLTTGLIRSVNSSDPTPPPPAEPVPSDFAQAPGRDVTLSQPHGVMGVTSLDRRTLVGSLFVADTANRRVVRFAIVEPQ